mgnify:CR=1 FL=1
MDVEDSALDRTARDKRAARAGRPEDQTNHDFRGHDSRLFIPAFRIKADVLPGKYTTQWFEATKPGTYHLFCAEYCGMNHSGMIGSVIVMQPADFDNWLSGNASQQSPAVAGQQLFQSLGCVSCHGANGEGGRGPALVGLFGSKVFLTNNQTLIADEAYIRESIENPAAKVVSGFSPIMPTFQGQVTPEQLIQIMSFIKSLQVTGPQSRDSRTHAQTGSDSGSGHGSRRSLVCVSYQELMKAFETFETPAAARVNYINAQYGLKSWLLTKDHKRIALLYLGSISSSFSWWVAFTQCLFASSC